VDGVFTKARGIKAVCPRCLPFLHGRRTAERLRELAKTHPGESAQFGNALAMFEESSAYYDLVYRVKDYAGEAKRVLSFAPPDARTLLDVGCGTGEHHRFFAESLTVQGVDLNAVFLETARAKNPTAKYFHADMKDFRLNRTYDMVTCLFGSIGYCQDLTALSAAVACLSAHLAPGGVLLVEPWITPEAWNPGRVFSDLLKTEGLEVCRMGHSRQEGRLSVMDFHYLVGETGKGVRHFQEQHRMGLFSQEEMADAMRQCGLTTEFDEVGLVGRGLHIGRT
jgi:SAM-dependent methyltransferase